MCFVVVFKLVFVDVVVRLTGLLRVMLDFAQNPVCVRIARRSSASRARGST